MPQPRYRDSSGCNYSRSSYSHCIVALVLSLALPVHKYTDHTKLLKLAICVHCRCTLPKAVINESFIFSGNCTCGCQRLSCGVPEWVIKPAYSPRYAHTVSSDSFARNSMKPDAFVASDFYIHLKVEKRFPSRIIWSRLLLFRTGWELHDKRFTWYIAYSYFNNQISNFR